MPLAMCKNAGSRYRRSAETEKDSAVPAFSNRNDITIVNSKVTQPSLSAGVGRMRSKRELSHLDHEDIKCIVGGIETVVDWVSKEVDVPR